MGNATPFHWLIVTLRGSVRKAAGTHTDEERVPADEEGTDQPSQDDVFMQPWKYVGYRGYAGFISSDNDFLIFRQFQKLSARVALRLQDRVTVLETRLIELDDSHSKKDSDPVNNGTFRNKKDDRESILNYIEIALDRYHEFLIRQANIKQFSPAPPRDVKNIRRWHENYDKRAINENQQSYLDQNDLVCLKGRDKPPLHQLINNSLRLRTLSIWRDKFHPTMKGSEWVKYYSDARMNAFVSVVITTIGTAMLITPIWILQKLGTLEKKLVVVTVFVFAFLLILSFAMATKPFEALGATAAYAAVLMVFVRVGGN
ncbi:hypothetical protein F5Y04DRAFT_184961 [Hypomontagnella monticulosa]|nr:hypothetical protein F5Y04DRAFT_184961 [Hypomontagnella monticulosa]